MSRNKNVWFFDEGFSPPSSTLARKGVNLAVLAGHKVCVPPGFTLEFEIDEKAGDCPGVPADVMDAAVAALASLEHQTGRQFARAANPLLVSVRAAAEPSPSASPTGILNVGMNDEIVESLIALTGNPRFVYDCYRRFLAGLTREVLGLTVPPEPLDDRTLPEEGRLRAQCDRIRDLWRERTGAEFPQSPHDQFRLAVCAMTAHSHGCANASVIVQCMVFGNMGADCGTGVAWSRSPVTGILENGGVYLRESQGDDLASHRRPTQSLAKLEADDGRIARQLRLIRTTFDRFAGPDVLFEFTVERGKVYVLGWKQVAARSPRFAHRAANQPLGLVSSAILAA